MTNHLVEGRPLPDHVAGHLALELCNTKALWGLPSEREYLTDFTVLALWAREHGVLTPAEAALARGAGLTDRQRAAELRRVRELRAAVFAAVTEGDVARDNAVDVVRRFVAHAVQRSAYCPAPDGGWRLAAPFGPTAVLDRLALAAHDLLERHGPDAVGLCASAACGWVFLNPSRRRRWCSMAVCGNRAKVRRFAERRRTVGASPAHDRARDRDRDHALGTLGRHGT
jgi:predicted RNA-binding Zn ribbon-like protein